MRKFVLSAFALCLTFGLALAAEVTFVKFDKETKELTVKEGDKESTYKLTDETKIKAGKKDKTVDEAVTFLSEKAKEGKTKFKIETDGDKLTEVHMMGGGKKDKDK